MVYVTQTNLSCSSSTSNSCNSLCDSNCVDFSTKRHDTRPPFKIKVVDCDGLPMDLTGFVLEASMWSKSQLKKDLNESDEYFALLNDVAFEQCKIGDIIVMDRVRAPEQMLIIGFDENLKYIKVQRGYNGTIISSFKRNTYLRIFRMLNSIATTEMDKQDIPQVDGTVKEDVLVESRLVYEWLADDTCLPGCYYFEFKLLKMTEEEGGGTPYMSTPSVTPSFISYTEDQMGCGLGLGVEWVRRFPQDREGFIVKIFDSPTSENVF